MNRRKVLLGLAAGTAGTTGLAFGSGAFSETTAEREFEIGLADSDEDSQLVIDENEELESAAITEDDGEFKIDATGVTPGARTTFGRFSDITEVNELEEGVFIIRNENETGEQIDIDIEIHGLDFSGDSKIELAILDPGGEVDGTASGSESIEVGVKNIPSAINDDTDDSDAEVEVGFIVDAGSDDDDLEGDLTIDAELSEEG